MKKDINAKDQEKSQELTPSAAEASAEAVKKGKQRKRSVLAFVVAAFVISTVVTLISCWSVSMAGKMHEIRSDSSDKAKTVANIVNDIYSSGLLLAPPPTDEPTERYYPPLSEKRKAMLQALCDSFDFKYLYLLSLDEQKSNITYLFVVSSDPAMNDTLEKERPYGTVVHMDSIPESMISAAHGKINNTFWEDDNDFGKTYGWAYPLVMDDENPDECLVIAAEFDVDQLNGEVINRALLMSIPFIVILIVNLLILLFIIRRKILKPIKTISTKMNSFADGGDLSDERLNMTKNDEIGEIANSFDKMSDDIKEYIDNINDLTTYRVQTNTQMEIAERIQYGIVPERTEISEKGLSACAIEKPAKLVGGDFYDCFMRDDTHFCMVMGDVSGKGITAALFMVMVKTAIREKLVSGMGPADILNIVNDEICATNPEGLFATVFVAELDTMTGLLRYANAGHTAPVIISGKAEYYRPDPGITVGLFEDAGIVEGSMLLKPGEGIVLYTDGVTEAVNPDDVFYGEDRLLCALEGSSGAAQAVNALKDSIMEFYGEREQFDDLTILSAFYTSSEETLTLKPELEEMERITRLLRSEAGGCRNLMQIILACEEIFANIVNYSEATMSVFCCRRLEDDVLCVEMLDDGIAFDPVSAEIPKKEFEDYDTGGMGISLVKQITSSVSYKRVGTFNVLRMTFDLSGK